MLHCFIAYIQGSEIRNEHMRSKKGSFLHRGSGIDSEQGQSGRSALVFASASADRC